MKFAVMIREPYKAKGKYIAGVNKNGTLKSTPRIDKAIMFSSEGADVIVFALKRSFSGFIITKEDASWL